MKVEYDPKRDLLYLWLAHPGTPFARTEVLSPGVHGDLDRDRNLIGIEVLEAKTVLGDDLRFEVALGAAA